MHRGAGNPTSTQPIHTAPLYNDTAPPPQKPTGSEYSPRTPIQGPMGSHTDRHKRLRGHLAPVAMPNMPTVTQNCGAFRSPGPRLSFHFATPQTQCLCFQPSLRNRQAPPSALEAWGFPVLLQGKPLSSEVASLLAGFIKAQIRTGSHSECL